MTVDAAPAALAKVGAVMITSVLADAAPAVLAKVGAAVIVDFVDGAAPPVLAEAALIVIAKAGTVVLAEAASYWDSRCRAKADSYSCCQGQLLLGLPVSTPVVAARAAPVVIADFVHGAAPVVIVEAGTVVIVGVVANSCYNSQEQGRVLLFLLRPPPTGIAGAEPRPTPTVVAKADCCWDCRCRLVLSLQWPLLS